MLEMHDSQFKTREQDREPPSPKASK
jgi:hypothetical protein